MQVVPDNAKKSFEKGVEIDGEVFYKKSEPHKASVTGDTVGDPFKDTSGPSMNILIKLMSIVSLVIAPSIPINGLLGLHKGDTPAIEQSSMMMEVPAVETSKKSGACCVKPSRIQAMTASSTDSKAGQACTSTTDQATNDSPGGEQVVASVK